MRILHVVAYPPNEIGGLMIYVKNLIYTLDRYGIKSEMITTDFTKNCDHRSKFERITVNYVKNYGDLFGVYPIFNILKFLYQNSERFDVLHVHAYIHLSSIQAILFAKVMKKPCVMTLHGTAGVTYLEGVSLKQFLLYAAKKYFFDRVIGKILLSFPDALTSVSKSDLLQINTTFNARRKKNNFWVPNAIPSDFGKEISKQVPKRQYVTFIGRLSAFKGFDLFIEIMKKVNQTIPNIPLLIIGEDGELKDLLEKSKHILNITHIKSIPHTEMPFYYKSSKIYLSSSRFEGMPTTILEAMFCETAVIATNCGGSKELIHDQVNGFTYEPTDVNKGAQLVKTLYTQEELQKTFINNSLKVIPNFLWENVAKKMIQIYKKILKN